MTTTATLSRTALSEQLKALVIAEVEGGSVDRGRLREVLWELGWSRVDFDRVVAIARERRANSLMASKVDISSDILELQERQKHIDNECREKLESLRQQMADVQRSAGVAWHDLQRQITEGRERSAQLVQSAQQLRQSCDPAITEELHRLYEQEAGWISTIETLLHERRELRAMNYDEQLATAHNERNRIQQRIGVLEATQLDWRSFAVN